MSNLTAFLAMVGDCEGATYNTLYGGGTFASFDDHPRQAVTAGGYTSTAAGRYQILARTFDDFKLARGSRKFDASGQDDCAVWLIERRGALADVEAGRLDTAIQKCGQEWASLPGSPYGQPTRTLQYCLDHYTAAGGTLSTQAAIEERPAVKQPESVMPTQTPTPNLLTAFGPILAALLPQVAKAFLPGTAGAVVQTIFDTVVAASGQPNLQSAVEAMQAEPAVKAKVQAAVVTQPDVMAVLEIGGGVKAAREADLAAVQSDKGIWRSPVFMISVLLLPLVYWLVGSVIAGGSAELPWFGGAWTGEARSGGFNLVIGLVLGGMCGLYYGTTVANQKRDDKLADKLTS